MKAVIFANGEMNERERGAVLLHSNDADLLICGDGGARHAHRFGIMPHIIIGDMDSVPGDVLSYFIDNGVHIQKYPPEKDETDLELCLRYAKEATADNIVVFGALGGRIDHELGNIYLFYGVFLQGFEIRIMGIDSELRFIAEGDNHFSGQCGDILSLLPFAGDAEGIVTEGLRYPLRSETLTVGTTRGISNEFVADTAMVHVDRGCLLSIRQITHSTVNGMFE